MRPAAEGRAGSHRLRLANGSTATAFPNTRGQSYSGTLAIIDEADKIEGKDALDRLLAAIKPTIDAGGRLLLISTAEKSRPESRFKKIFRAGMTGGFHCLFYPWSLRPSRTQEWYESEKAKCYAQIGSYDWLWQEYPSTAEEALAANTLDKRIPPQWLAACYQPLPVLDLADPKMILYHLESPAPSLAQLRVYVLPRPGRSYVVGADPAEGNPTSDDSALCVCDRDTGEEVCTLAHKYEPAVFASHIANVARWYNEASVMIERLNHGHAVLLWRRDNAPDVFRLKGHDGEKG